ncbi:branched-chain amino acid transport system permease protein [Nocardioides daedukensis]|uniref:Branched-chain amino acid transport system permease protein n=1 Tax=Nocardioides daedukensis TaxID=634462 RepID=A0A7Y9S0N0_9ACTN|nr:branched-chain amino acid ABC transporter permease [Nocardioides daedukensis]NYG59755.1 branched-chain amino acid transport system permease protein [Nocardioides daedukensis]
MNVFTMLREQQRPVRAPRPLVILGLVALLGWLIWQPMVSAPYVNFDRSMVLVFVVVGLGLNLLTGLTGQISLGHGAFFALGAYLSATLVNEYAWNYLAVVPLAAVVAWALGYLVGRPVLRFSGLQLALVTLSLALITPSIIKAFDDITHGQEGIILDTAEPPGAVGLERDQWVYYLCLAAAIATYVVCQRLASGRVGRSLIAIRDNETVGATLGVRAAVIKTRVFALSTALAGVAGVLYTWVVQFVGPDAFGLTLAITFIILIVVGGLGAMPGVVFGALFVVYVPTYTASLDQSAAGLSFGVALLFFMFLLPTGVIGLVRVIARGLTRGRRKGAAGRTTGDTAQESAERADREAALPLDA